jgi:hypothetical protein
MRRIYLGGSDKLKKEKTKLKNNQTLNSNKTRLVNDKKESANKIKPNLGKNDNKLVVDN